MKLGRDEVLMVPTSVVVIRPDPPKGGSMAGQKKVTGSPTSRNFFFRPKGNSNKPNT